MEVSYWPHIIQVGLTDIPQDYTLADGGVIPSYSFALYDQTEGGAFLPFNGPGQEENLAFGMTMTATVTIPEEGVPMSLELGSSDDLWIFLDGRLVLDLSGGNTAGAVSFSGETSVTTGDGSVTVGPAKDFYYAIQNHVSDMLTQNLSPEETAALMADELNGLLQQYSKANP